MVNGNVSVALTNSCYNSEGDYRYNNTSITHSQRGTYLVDLPATNGTSVEIPSDSSEEQVSRELLVVAIPIAVTTANDPDFDPLIDCVQEILVHK